MPLIDTFVLFIEYVFSLFLYLSTDPLILKYLHIDDIKTTKSSPQEAYFPSQKPLSIIRGKYHKLLSVKLSQEVDNKMHNARFASG